MKMKQKNRIRITQIIAQLKLALAEEDRFDQYEAIEYAQKTLKIVHDDLLNVAPEPARDREAVPFSEVLKNTREKAESEKTPATK